MPLTRASYAITVDGTTSETMIWGFYGSTLSSMNYLPIYRVEKSNTGGTRGGMKLISSGLPETVSPSRLNASGPEAKLIYPTCRRFGKRIQRERILWSHKM